MAIYHFSAQIISRSQGRSCVAAAAYRSAEKIIDEHTGLTHDFTKKNDVRMSEVLLPEGAPEWMASRSELWNKIEQTEKRKDAQVAREINIALPKELTLEQNWKLAKSFVQKEFVSRGMVADMNVHSGHKDQEEQPHVHIMLTMREVTADGFGQKVRAWNDKALLNNWREHWAEACNLELARLGIDVSIDHRTLEAQGIALEPQSKIGAKSAQVQMARFEEHQALAERNGERLLQDPGIALHALTQQQSTFTHQDIARFVNRHSVGEEQFRAVYEKVKAHPVLVHLGQDDKQRDRYTTREMLLLETTMVEDAQWLSNTYGHAVSANIQAQVLVEQRLSPEQEAAFLHVTAANELACVVGFAGTGKSYMLGAAKEAWERAGFRVQGMTLSGVAADNLEGGSGIKSHTIANRLLNWENGREKLTERDIVVVDEVGMVGSLQMARLLQEARSARAKLVLGGDPEQLQSIGAGSALRALLPHTGHIEMTAIRRQEVSWQRDATRAFACNKTGEALNAYAMHDHVHEFTTKESAMNSMVEQWQEIRSSEPHKSQLMLAYTRADVGELNTKARQMRKADGELGQDHEIETARGKRSFANSDRIYFLRNEKSLGVKNGTLGTIEHIENKQLSVRLDTQKTEKTQRVQFHTRDYNDIDHGYAATIHKSQGMTVDRSYLLASKYLDRHATYVALSRHRLGAEVYWSRDEFSDFKTVQSTLSRERLKDTSLDYAKARGLDTGPEINVGAIPLNEAGATTHHKAQEEKLKTPSFDTLLSAETKARYDALLQKALHGYSELRTDEWLQKKSSVKTSPTEKTIDPDKLFPTGLAEKSKPAAREMDAHWNAFNQRHDFSQFKADFEKSRPEQARQLKDSVRPYHEKQALEVLNHWHTIQKAKHTRLSLQELTQVKSLVKEVKAATQKAEVWNYLKNNHPQEAKKIGDSLHLGDRERERDRGGRSR